MLHITKLGSFSVIAHLTFSFRIVFFIYYTIFFTISLTIFSSLFLTNNWCNFYITLILSPLKWTIAPMIFYCSFQDPQGIMASVDGFSSLPLAVGSHSLAVCSNSNTILSSPPLFPVLSPADYVWASFSVIKDSSRGISILISMPVL